MIWGLESKSELSMQPELYRWFWGLGLYMVSFFDNPITSSAKWWLLVCKLNYISHFLGAFTIRCTYVLLLLPLSFILFFFFSPFNVKLTRLWKGKRKEKKIEFLSKLKHVVPLVWLTKEGGQKIKRECEKWTKKVDKVGKFENFYLLSLE